MEARVSAGLTAAEGRKFGLTVGLAFAAIAVVSRWRGHVIPPYVFGALGALLMVGGFVFPSRLGPIQRLWMGLAHALSRVTTPLFMGVLYFGVLTPIALVRRLSGGNPLGSTSSASLWVDRPAENRRSDLERQF